MRHAYRGMAGTQGAVHMPKSGDWQWSPVNANGSLMQFYVSVQDKIQDPYDDMDAKRGSSNI